MSKSSNVQVRENVSFAGGLHKVKFVASRGKVTAVVVGQHTPVGSNFPELTVTRDDDGTFGVTSHNHIGVKVWGATPAKAFARGVRCFWNCGPSVRR